jgi:uncharacterized protein (TIGR00369 family)
MSIESPMLETESSITKLSDLPYPNLQEYLEESADFYALNKIPLEESYYDSEKGEFVIEMTVPVESQAYKGYAHGGYISTLLDTGAGMASMIKASEKGQSVVTKELVINYRLPLEVGSLIKVVGKITTSEENGSEATASIIQMGEKERVLARGIAKMRYRSI